MRLTIDFETRSEADIKQVGSWRYAEHPSTEILCCAVKVDARPVAIWFPYWVYQQIAAVQNPFEGHFLSDFQLAQLIEAADEIEAHNCGHFEAPIWEYCASPKYGWPEIPRHKFRDSMAQCCMQGIPRSLDKACRFLNLPVQKDTEGYKLMLRMCKPRKPTKSNPAQWVEDAESIIRLAQYCRQDVEAEYALSNALAPLPPGEQEAWALDHRINHRGLRVDVPTARRMVGHIEAHEAKLLAEAKALTGGISPTQVAASVRWCASNGVKLASFDREAVTAARKNTPPANVDRFLAIRQSLGKSSTAKYKAMIDRANADGRIRGTMLYHGAATGRVAGHNGLQPQNLPRGAFGDTVACIAHINANGFDDDLDFLWGDPMHAASTCIRGMIMAAPGHSLFVSDFASIEARVLAWLAAEVDTLAAFRAGKDLYKVAATSIFGVHYDAITKGQRQVGKACVLGLGYGGGIGAFATMAAVYGIDLETLPAIVLPGAAENVVSRANLNAKNFAKTNPDAMSHDAAMACDVIKQLWRQANPNIVGFWRGLEDAVKSAIEDSGQAYQYGPIKTKITDNFLRVRLPSGRCLYYYSPSIRQRKSKILVERDGQEIEIEIIRATPFYVAGDANWVPAAGRWSETATYGGKLAENVTQAVARDLMIEATKRLEGAGYPIVLTVHDEIVAEVPDGFGSLDNFSRIMAEIPEWARGCPVDAEGFACQRYRK